MSIKYFYSQKYVPERSHIRVAKTNEAKIQGKDLVVVGGGGGGGDEAVWTGKVEIGIKRNFWQWAKHAWLHSNLLHRL